MYNFVNFHLYCTCCIYSQLFLTVYNLYGNNIWICITLKVIFKFCRTISLPAVSNLRSYKLNLWLALLLRTLTFIYFAPHPRNPPFLQDSFGRNEQFCTMLRDELFGFSFKQLKRFIAVYGNYAGIHIHKMSNGTPLIYKTGWNTCCPCLTEKTSEYLKYLPFLYS